MNIFYFIVKNAFQHVGQYHEVALSCNMEVHYHTKSSDCCYYLSINEIIVTAKIMIWIPFPWFESYNASFID